MRPRTVVRLVADLEYDEEGLGGSRVVKLAAGTRGVVVGTSPSDKVWVGFLSPGLDIESDPDMVEPDVPAR